MTNTKKDTKSSKTHWLQNPNKNYLGHWDLPGGEDVILTICSAKWEEVKNPIINTSEAKRVIRFVEEHHWVKPFICNEVNADMICKMTEEKFMEDSPGKKIKIGIGTVKVKREEMDCLRVRNLSHKLLDDKLIGIHQLRVLEETLEAAGKDKMEFCKAMKIESVPKLPLCKFEGVLKRLQEIVGEKNGNN